MKATNIFIGALLAATLLTATHCTQKQPSAKQDPFAAWKEHLDIWKKDYVPSDYEGDLKELHLTDYTYKGKVESPEQLAQVADSLFADNAPKAYVLETVEETDTIVTGSGDSAEIRIKQKSYPKFEICTIRQLIDEGKQSADSVAQEKQRILKHFPIGGDWLELCFEYKGKNYRAIWLFADEGPYEYMTSSLFWHTRTRTALPVRKKSDVPNS